jgi:conjugative relaxase-like TrwC/TraI family protein
MTVSIKRLSAGLGYRYLMKSVAAGDGDRAQSTPLTRYYNESGTPPGRWIGTGLAALNSGGGIAAGEIATEQQMFQLFGMGNDPITGEQLSLRPYVLPSETHPGSVAGFDLTFSAQKSVSVLWALADVETQKQIVEAHHEAMAKCLALLEADVAATRVGTNGVAQADVTGLVAVAFDHWDSRAGDPQLHTHLVVANRVQTVDDGVWRTLDSRALHASIVAVSEYYNALLADKITARLGLGWEQRARGRSRNPKWEIAGVPDTLIEEFSQRSKAIEVAKDDLIDSFRRRHGRTPTPDEVLRLRQQATLATRPDKHIQPLSELAHEWRERGGQTLQLDAEVWAKELLVVANAELHHGDITPEIVAQLGESVVATVSTKRSTWTRWNLHAETSRHLMGLRVQDEAVRDRITNSVVAAAVSASITLAAPSIALTPTKFLRLDGTTRFARQNAERYTSRTVLDAEARLLQAAADTRAPAVADAGRIAATQPVRHVELAAEQLRAVELIATSGRTLDLLVGPAGTGKTAILAGLRAAWESSFGTGSVIGLAPSASAAEVLAEELGIPTENTSKWLAELDREPERLLDFDRLRTASGHERSRQVDAIACEIARWQLHHGQLVIIDEASLAGTLTLARITDQARDAGAKVLLVGDSAQLSSIDAGGAFAMLVNRRSDAPGLETVRRFTALWEGPASRALRLGDVTSLDAYREHGRIQAAPEAETLTAAYLAWRADEAAGRRSLLLAGDGDTVDALNARARHDLVSDGIVQTDGTLLSSGLIAGVGDRIVTRKNNRTLRPGAGFVKNGDEWNVVARHRDGALTATRIDDGQTVRLPAGYVAEHVDLGYATTAYRSQGRTVDTAHAIVTASMTREVLYVAMTRGRDFNGAYVITEPTDAACVTPDSPFHAMASDVLRGVLARVGADTAAHDVLAAEQERAAGIAQLADEYETIAAAAQADRWMDLIGRSGLAQDQVQDVVDSPSFGALCAALRQAESVGQSIDEVLPKLVAARSLADAEDVASVLHERVSRWTHLAAEPCATAHDFIVGLLPRASGRIEPDVRDALAERERLLTIRANAILDTALASDETWIRDLGKPPSAPTARAAWRREAVTVAAFRDRYRDGAIPTSGYDEQRSLAAAARNRGRLIAERDAAPDPKPFMTTTVHRDLSRGIHR